MYETRTPKVSLESVFSRTFLCFFNRRTPQADPERAWRSRLRVRKRGPLGGLERQAPCSSAQEGDKPSPEWSAGLLGGRHSSSSPVLWRSGQIRYEYATRNTAAPVGPFSLQQHSALRAGRLEPYSEQQVPEHAVDRPEPYASDHHQAGGLPPLVGVSRQHVPAAGGQEDYPHDDYRSDQGLQRVAHDG